MGYYFWDLYITIREEREHIRANLLNVNSEILFNTINKNVSISFEIQTHQNANLKLIDQVVTKYSAVWLEIRQVVDISEKYWMQIHLKNNWEIISIKLKHKFYLVSVNEHTIIDEIFDKLHNQKKTY